MPSRRGMERRVGLGIPTSPGPLPDLFPASRSTLRITQAGVAPAVIYAFRKTGRIITKDNAKFVPAAALEAWQHAIDEYAALIEDQETEPQ